MCMRVCVRVCVCAFLFVHACGRTCVCVREAGVYTRVCTCVCTRLLACGGVYTRVRACTGIVRGPSPAAPPLPCGVPAGPGRAAAPLPLSGRRAAGRAARETLATPRLGLQPGLAGARVPLAAPGAGTRDLPAPAPRSCHRGPGSRSHSSAMAAARSRLGQKREQPGGILAQQRGQSLCPCPASPAPGVHGAPARVPAPPCLPRARMMHRDQVPLPPRARLGLCAPPAWGSSALGTRNRSSLAASRPPPARP